MVFLAQVIVQRVDQPPVWPASNGLGYLNLTIGENVQPGWSTTEALNAIDLDGGVVRYSPASTPGPFNISSSGNGASARAALFQSFKLDTAVPPFRMPSLLQSSS